MAVFFSKYHGQPCFLLIFLDTIMPERSIRVHETDRPWMSSQLKGFISRRQRAFTHGNDLLFKMSRNKVNRERKGCRKVHYYYQNKVKDLRDTKPRDWWREVKQLCDSAKASKRDLQSILHPDLNFDDKILSEKIKAFVSIIEDFLPLHDDMCVEDCDDEPITVTEWVVVSKLRTVSTSRAGVPMISL